MNPRQRSSFRSIVFAALLSLPTSALAQIGIPVEIVNPPDLPVPVIRTDRLPIPPELLNFQRQYCGRWNGPRLVTENGERRLVEYRAQLPTIRFPNRVFWMGDLLGTLVGTERSVSIGWQGAIEVTTACRVPVPPGFVPAFIPQLNPRSLNLYRISEEVSGYACDFNQEYPVDILVRARVLEYKGLVNDLPVVPEEGDGRVCMNIDFIGPAPED